MKTNRRTLPLAFWTALVGAILLILIWACHRVGPVVVRAQSGACPQGPVDQAGGTWQTYYCTQFNSLGSSEDVPPVAGNDGSWLTGGACGGNWQIGIEYDAAIGSNVLKMTAVNSRCYGYTWRDDDETGSGSGGSHPRGGTFPLRTGGRDGVRVRMRLRPVAPEFPFSFCNTAGYGVNGTTYYWPGSNPNLVLSMLGLYGQTNGPSRWYREMNGGYSQNSNFSCNNLPGYVDLLLTGLESAGGGTPTWTYRLSSDGGATWQTVWSHTGEIGWPLSISFGDPTLQTWPGLWPPLAVDFFSTEYWTQATPTPPPTATPYVQAFARNPQGQAVNVAGMGRSRFDVGGPGYASFYPDRSSYTGAALDYAGRDERGAFFRSYADQVLMGITPSPNGVAWQNGTTDLYYGWPNWYTGGRSVVAVYATATPTPTPTNTPTSTPTPTPTNTPTSTPSPTPTNTPTNTPTPPPYVLPPEIRPFLHLRGHEPPYIEQQIDYLAGDDIHYYAQVYLHAVPAAEVITPPQYCEWTGIGWTCTSADAFEWLDYSFRGVRREGYWFPSPVGEVTKDYSSDQHIFDPFPRWTDPDYLWPREFLHLYFNLPAGSTPPCPVSGLDGPCIVYDSRAPGEEILMATLRGRATWSSPPWNEEFELAVEYPLILSATQWEVP